MATMKIGHNSSKAHKYCAMEKDYSVSTFFSSYWFALFD